MSFNIAIDGPAGAGKSTIAKKIAKELGFVYVDTGAMYRAMALYFLRSNISNEDEQAISRASENVEITIQYENGEQQVFLNGENVSGEIRKEEVGKKADVVMDGRDIGTVVLPDAQVKAYLTASVATRAKRRYDELSEKGQECNLEKIEADIEQRDYQDMHRENSPLRQAEDATLVDSSDMSIEEVVAAIKKLYEDVCNA